MTPLQCINSTSTLNQTQSLSASQLSYYIEVGSWVTTLVCFDLCLDSIWNNPDRIGVRIYGLENPTFMNIWQLALKVIGNEHLKLRTCLTLGFRCLKCDNCV